MKTLFLTVAAAALIFASPAAFAKDHHGNDPAGNGAPPHANAGNAGNPGGAPHGQGHSGNHGNAGNAVVANPQANVNNNSSGRHGHHNRSTNNAFNNNNNNNNARGNNNNARNNGRHNNRHTGNGTHVTINFNRHNVSASRHFHYRGGAYRWPGNYHYQRWSYGMTLPSVFWARDYWIDDYSDYGLAYPPDGAVWVRYGADAILIDQYTGEILEVVYGQFY